MSEMTDPISERRPAIAAMVDLTSERFEDTSASFGTMARRRDESMPVLRAAMSVMVDFTTARLEATLTGFGAVSTCCGEAMLVSSATESYKVRVIKGDASSRILLSECFKVRRSEMEMDEEVAMEGKGKRRKVLAPYHVPDDDTPIQGE